MSNTLGARIKAHKEQTRDSILNWLTRVVERSLNDFLTMDKVEIELPDNFETVRSTVLQVAIEQELSIEFVNKHGSYCACYDDVDGPLPEGCTTMCVISLKYH